MKQAKTPNKWA